MATAIAAIPTNIRKLGLKITFQVSATNTETWEFFNGTIGNITNVAYWRKTDLDLKIDKTAIKQALGDSETDIMSQKAVSEITKSQAIQILKQQDSSLIFKGFAKPDDDTPTATLNHAYYVIETGTVFGVEATEGQVLVGNGTGFEVLEVNGIMATNSLLAANIIRSYNPDYKFKGFAYPGLTVPSDVQIGDCYLAIEEGTIFLRSGAKVGDILVRRDDNVVFTLIRPFSTRLLLDNNNYINRRIVSFPDKAYDFNTAFSFIQKLECWVENPENDVYGIKTIGWQESNSRILFIFYKNGIQHTVYSETGITAQPTGIKKYSVYR